MGEFEDANKFNDATRFGEGMKQLKVGTCSRFTRAEETFLTKEEGNK